MSLITLKERVHSGHSMARTLLLLFALTGAVIVGLLAMHSLNTHGLSSHPGGSSAVHVASSEASLHQAEHHSGGAGDEEPVCADCGTGHGDMMAMACVLALLVAVLLLTRPSHLTGSLSQMHRVYGPSSGRQHRMLPRPPSLDILCISRT